VELVSRFPEQKFVLDHMAKPFIKSGFMEPWREDIDSLAALPNVWCKISGMVTEADLKNWKYEDFIPYLDAVIKAFGTDRIMLGSDWPVCRLGGEYKEVLDIPITYFRDHPSLERDKIFQMNCINFYELAEH
jgi:L-fuconolactonase